MQKIKIITRCLLLIYIMQVCLLPWAQAQRGIFIPPSTPSSNGEPGDFENNFPPDYNRPTNNPNSNIGITNPKDILNAGGLVYQIHILGQVKFPGTYRIPASTRVSEALGLAGGLKPNGSERNIELRRSVSSRRVDLSAYKFSGKLEQNPYLMDNDVVFIPIKRKTIEIQGSIINPGIYELTSEQSLADVIRLSGGFAQGASHKDPIRVVRYDANEEKNVVEVSSDHDDLRRFHIEDGDVIFVPHLFTTKNTFDYNLKKLPKDNLYYPSSENRVFVLGAVNTPGAYPFSHYYHLNQYLALAGGTNRLSKNKVRIVGLDGQVKQVNLKKDNLALVINPGDTIYIPQRALTPETWASLVLSIASFGLGITSTVVNLRNAK